MKVKNRITIALLFILFVVIGGVTFYIYKQPVSYVGIDINPSLQLALNRIDRVVGVIPLNEDAEVLVSDLNLLNMPVEKVIETVVDNSVNSGFIDEFSVNNVVVVGASLNDGKDPKALEKRIRTTVINRLGEKKVPAIVLLEQDNEDRKALADSYGVSYGSLLIAQKAVSLNQDLNLDEIIKDSVAVNAKRMSDAHEKLIKNKLEDNRDLINEKEILKQQNLERSEERIQKMLKEAEQVRNEITEKNREQYREQLVNDKKEELMANVETVREQVERNWGSPSDQSKDNHDNIPIDVQEKVKNIKDKWNGRTR